MIAIGRLDYRRIYSFLLELVIIILIIDPMREALGLVGGALSLIKDFFVLLIFSLLLISHEKKIHSVFILLATLSCVFLYILSLFANIDKGDSLYWFYCLLRGVIICFVIINISNYYVHPITRLMRIFIMGAVVDFIITLVIYFAFPNLLIDKNYINRISVGNPSIQSIIFVCAFFLCFYYRPFQPTVAYLISIFLFIASISTVTSTANVALTIFFLLTIFDKKYFFSWLSLFSFAGIVVVVLMVKQKVDLSPYIQFLTDKLDELAQLVSTYTTERGSQIESRSFNIREEQIERFRESIDGVSLLFGDGVFSLIDPRKTMIENTYWAVLKDFGIFGFVTYLIFIIKYIVLGVQRWVRYQSPMVLGAILIFVVYSFTLYIFTAISMIAVLVLTLNIVCLIEIGNSSYISMPRVRMK